jgi:GNAT superfamily N-acetyltransferase
MIPFEVIALSPYAREMLAEIASRRALRRFYDAVDRLIEIRPWEGEDWTALTTLYDAFFAGLDRTRAFPPLNAHQRVSWLEQLTTRGPNLVAHAGNRIIGHAALIAYDGGVSHELVLFVHPDYRGAGIGGALLDAVLQVARREGVSRMWLTADRQHTLASGLYVQRGFRRELERVAGRELWTVDVREVTPQAWQRFERFAATAMGAMGVRLKAVVRAVRLVMIPLVCALITAAVSEDPRGRALALILAAISVLFGLAVQMRTIVFGKAAEPRVPNDAPKTTGEWLARLR